MVIEEYLFYGSAAIIVAVIIVVLYRRTHTKMKHGEILAADVMKAKYNLTVEHYKPLRMNPERVPQHLRDLREQDLRSGVRPPDPSAERQRATGVEHQPRRGKERPLRGVPGL